MCKKLMQEAHAVATMKSTNTERKLLWKAAIKWPLYSVAVMPIILAASWKICTSAFINFSQLIGFLIASVLLLLWENLSNDLFDADTGVDKFKLHSVVNLLGNKEIVRRIAYVPLAIGLGLMLVMASKSTVSVFWLVLGSCALGYLYQGPPFRLGYRGLGEPLCWLAFGPFATAAALLVLSPQTHTKSLIPWTEATLLGAGPALATTLVLFCSHFHQVAQDAANGKNSPLVLLGTQRSAAIIPWILAVIMTFEVVPILFGEWPITALLACIGLPQGLKLVRLLKKHHNHPAKISSSKFLALRFQALNGFGLSIGFLISPLLKLGSFNSF